MFQNYTFFTDRQKYQMGKYYISVKPPPTGSIDHCRGSVHNTLTAVVEVGYHSILFHRLLSHLGVHINLAEGHDVGGLADRIVKVCFPFGYLRTKRQAEKTAK
jgi:hypothetical protein